MTLDLTKSEARFLALQLGLHVQHMQNELVHTDQRELKRAIAADLEALERIRARLAYVTSRLADEQPS